MKTPRVLAPSLAALLAIGTAAVPLSASGERPPRDDADLRAWLENMVVHHRFTDGEVSAATGLSPDEVAKARERFDLVPGKNEGGIRLLPYPGGRHPRIGFLEGAIDPQRETKVSVFTPWGDGSDYVVVDVPEAIWSNLGLTYLAHTHVETIWTKQDIVLPRMEWERGDDGALHLDRTLPNGIRYEADVALVGDHLEMELRLHNGTDAELTDLRVQNCVMLKGAPEFAALTNDNKRLEAPFAAVRSGTHPGRWIITAWEPCFRPWGNSRCPCLHSDPKFPDCPPGETRNVRGWLSFYEGEDLDAEFARIAKAFFGR